MSSVSKARQELLAAFRRGTLERIEKIGLCWVAVEKNPADQAAVEELQRELHSVKGEANMMGFADVSLVAHRAEELVRYARERSFTGLGTLGDVLLAMSDAIAALVQKEAASPKPTVDLAQLLRRCDEILQPGGPAAESARPAAPAPKAPEPAATEAARTPEAARWLHVALESVEAFGQSTGENVIAHARYAHAIGLLQQLVAEALDDRQGDSARPALEQIERALVGLEQQVYEGGVLARALDREAAELRLIPIEGLLSRYVRLVRDLAREHGKQITVDLQNLAERIDCDIAQKLADPLLHIVRNCVDHGIEPPDERVRAGKAAEGRITLATKQQASSMIVTVADDGRGIDLTRVRARARDLGWLSPEASAALSDEDCLNYLFRPGFSTRDAATETSGRGIGLDVAKRSIELLGGVVRVTSTPGHGTEFQLQVPSTITLTHVLLVRAADTLLALPSRTAEAVAALTAADVVHVHRHRAMRFQGRTIPLIDLAQLLDPAAPPTAVGRAVVVCHEHLTVALLITEWLREAEVMVKPHGALLATRILTGACVLEQGELVLVLNPAELLARARDELVRPRADSPAEAGLVTERRILLVEDQAVTRAMVAQVLRAFGYEVVEAADGREGLATLARESVDLVLTDIEMPVMDGIELIRGVREKPEWRHLPVVVLSTRGSEQDRLAALEVGADEYLVKTNFSEAALREVMRRRLGDH